MYSFATTTPYQGGGGLPRPHAGPGGFSIDRRAGRASLFFRPHSGAPRHGAATALAGIDVLLTGVGQEDLVMDRPVIRGGGPGGGGAIGGATFAPKPLSGNSLLYKLLWK